MRRTKVLTPHLMRVTVGGRELDGLDPGLPGASVRLLLPRRGTTELVLPTWNGNEFLLPDGSRPVLRTLTPRRLDAGALELDVDIVLHDGGPLPTWAAAAEPGDAVAVSGTGRGYTVDPDASMFLLAGDETAIPAVAQLLEALPHAAQVEVILEVAHPDGRLELPMHPGARVLWVDRSRGARPGDALVGAVERAPLDADARVWAAGEAAAMHRIRRHLTEGQGLARSAAVVRGYWKHGRGGGLDEG